MKKEMKLVFIFLIMVSMAFVNAQIIKPNKNQYYTGESVSVISSVSSNDLLCRANTNENVKLFIVEHKETWGGSESLEDIRGDYSEVPNSKFSSKKVWEGIIIGLYDLIVDCNDNGNYDLGEPLYKEGFSIIAKQGSGDIIFGNQNDVSWQYDPEDFQSSVVISSFKLSAKNENIALKNLTMRFVNSASLSIDAVEVYVDGNSNGKTEDDTKIGEMIVTEFLTNKIASIPLEYTVNDGTTDSLLVVYKMKEQTAQGSYSAEILSVAGEGALSEKTILFNGLPLQSSLLNVVQKKTCLGEMKLMIEPASVYINEKIVMKVSNLEGCDTKKVILKSNFCYLSAGEIGSCTLQSGACSLEITALNSISYYSCMDKNNDNDYSDVGESTSADVTVVVIEPSVVIPEKESLEAPITGEVVEATEKESETQPSSTSAITDYFTQTNPFLLVLEVTLVLILLVLLMIFFRIGASASESASALVSKSASQETASELVEPKKKKVKETKEAKEE